MLNPDTFLLRGASDRLFLNRDVSASRFFFIRPDECLSVLYGVVTDVSDGFRVWQTRGRCCRVLVVFELAPSVARCRNQNLLRLKKVGLRLERCSKPLCKLCRK